MANQSLLDGKLQEVNGSIGLVQWFPVNQYEEVEKAIIDFKKLGITQIRVPLSWALWQTESGRQWYEWLIPALAKELDVLPCVGNTPPALALKPTPAAPPRNADDFASFIEELIAALGTCFEYLELWNEPNRPSSYDYTMDAGWTIFSAMVGKAAQLLRKKGKKAVLGGMNPVDPAWLQQLFTHDALQHIDVVAIHGFTDGTDANGDQWQADITRIQEVLDAYHSNARIWITEAGFSTRQHDERTQVKAFINALHAGAERLYWNGWKDMPSEQPGGFGMKNSHDQPRLLYTLLATRGLENIADFDWMTERVIGKPAGKQDDTYTLITGGSGFVGVNLADRLLEAGEKVLVFDNLSRAGVENNLFWLKEKHPHNLQIMIADIRDKNAVTQAVSRAKQIFHLAAQVAVTSSLENPYHDFEVNALGTLNLLEAVRHSATVPPIVFASTNKVYGDLDDLGITMNGTRYHVENSYFRQQGISEQRPLDFHSPYGCTKGVADQYMLDYARTFGLKTVVFRMSCIYGPHQFGTEDQGWVAHFLIQALKNKPITLYGDGKQVRDILFVEDLLNAYLLAMENIHSISGTAFNMGGGVHNTVSLLELCDLIGDIAGKKPLVKFDNWRPSDQKYYVSDFSKFSGLTGWAPQVGTREGVQRLYEWLQENAGMPAPKGESKRQKLGNLI